MTLSPVTDRTDPPTSSLQPPANQIHPSRQPLTGARARPAVPDRWPGPAVGPARQLAACCLVLGPLALALRSGLAGDRAVAAGLLAVSAALVTVLVAGIRPPRGRVAGAHARRRALRRAGALTCLAVLVHVVTSVLDDRAVPTWLAAGAAITALGAAAVARQTSPNAQAAPWSVVLAVTALHVQQLADAAGDTLTTSSLAVLGVTVAALLAHDALRATLAGRAAFTVDRIERADRRLVLAPVGGRRTPGLHPGQFAWLHLDHPWGPRLPRPLTVVPAQDRPGRLELALEPEDGAPAALRSGRRVYVDGPHDPVDDHHQGGLLFVTDGTGIQLMIGVLRLQAARRDGRPHCLVIGGGGGGNAIGRSVRRDLQRLAVDLDLDVVPLRCDVARRRARWSGPAAPAAIAQALRHHPALAASHAYVYAPKDQLAGLSGGLVDLGLPPARIHTHPLAGPADQAVTRSTGQGPVRQPARN